MNTKAADGEVVVAPFTSRFWRNFARAVGRDDLAGSEAYRSFGRRLRAKDELLAEFTPILRERTVDEWVAAFAEADVPAGPVLSLESAVSLPHTLARGMVADVGGQRTLRSPLRFRFPDGSTFRPEPGAVRTDEDADTVLADRTAS